MSSTLNPTKEKILKSARNLLESGEASKVRMGDIAKAAGISRQALYLHYPNRAELLVTLVRWMDEVHEVDQLLIPSRTAPDGKARLDAFIEAWGSYIPVIYGVGKALMAMMDSDAEARAAWEDRMGALKHGCAAAVRDLSRDGMLQDGLTPDQATDLLWTLLSVRNWEQLRLTCGWTQEAYIAQIKHLSERCLLHPTAT